MTAESQLLPKIIATCKVYQADQQLTVLQICCGWAVLAVEQSYHYLCA
jgi:hypothetical protein